MIWRWSHLFFSIYELVSPHTFQFCGRKENAANNCRGIAQFLNMPFSQSEAIQIPRLTLTKPTCLSICHSRPFSFDWLFFCPQIAKCLKRLLSAWLLWVRYVDLAGVYFPHRLSLSTFLWQRSCASLLHFSSELHRMAASLAPRGFPLKHRRGGSNGQRSCRRPNETQAAVLNSYNKDSGPFKEDRSAKSLL